jgi:hypothetical protein
MPPLPKRRISHSRSGKSWSKKAQEFKKKTENTFFGKTSRKRSADAKTAKTEKATANQAQS